MGETYAEITLKNAGDVTRLQDGHIKEPEIRQVTVKALVDTGARTLVISGELCQKLGLRTEGERRAVLADGTKHIYNLTEPVNIRWKNRAVNCDALVVPGADEVLLGVIPLEAMDLRVNPVEQILEGAHGDEVVCLLK